MKKTIASAVIFLTLWACANNKSAATSDESAATSDESAAPTATAVRFKEPDAFYSLLNFTHGNYVPLSEQELIEQSEVIARGQVIDVKGGVELRNVHSKIQSTLYTLVIELAVRSSMKGQPDNGSVYFEYLHGGAFSVETYRMNLPAEEVMVFLSPAEHLKHEAIEYVGEGQGYPEGATLYRLTTPQGWLIMKNEEIHQPLEPRDDLFGDAASLEEVEQAYSTTPDAGTAAGTEGADSGVP